MAADPSQRVALEESATTLERWRDELKMKGGELIPASSRFQIDSLQLLRSVLAAFQLKGTSRALGEAVKASIVAACPNFLVTAMLEGLQSGQVPSARSVSRGFLALDVAMPF